MGIKTALAVTQCGTFTMALGLQSPHLSVRNDALTGVDVLSLDKKSHARCLCYKTLQLKPIYSSGCSREKMASNGSVRKSADNCYRCTEPSVYLRITVIWTFRFIRHTQSVRPDYSILYILALLYSPFYTPYLLQ